MRVDLHKAANQLSIGYNEDGTEIVLTFKYSDHYDAMLAFDTMARRRRLQRVAAPTLFIRGESDGLVSQTYLDAFSRMLPDARTLTIKAAGHMPQLEQPAFFATAVLEFFGE
jgi:pimeloyl-ACP methyl ester carboxylesterase